GATGRGQRDPHRQRDRSRHADTADAGRHPQPVAPAAPGNVRLRHVQDRAVGHALAGTRHRGHLRRARHPGRDRGGREHAAFSGGGARWRLRDIDRRPGWTAGPRDDREAADGGPPGGPACHAERIQELVRWLTHGCDPAGVATGPAPFLPRCGRYVSWPEAAWWGRTTRGRRSTSRLTSNHKRTARRLLTSRESGGSSMATPSSI